MAKTKPLLQIAPVLFLVFALLMPPEIRVTIEGQSLYSYRIASLILLPWLLSEAVRKPHEYKLVDVFVLLAAAWVIVSFVMLYDLGRGITSGLGVVLDYVVPYFVVRFCVTKIEDLRRLIVILAPVIIVLVLVLALEAVTHARFVRNTAQLMFGSLGLEEYGDTSLPTIQSDTRFGLLRAMGPFSHPILAGLFFVSFFALVIFSRVRGWPFLAGLTAAAGAVVTLSSAALLGLILVIGLAGYERLKRLVSFLNWPLFVSFAGLVMLFLHLISEGGLINVLIRYTFTPQSGYYRLLIWEYGSQTVSQNPLFGIGYDTFNRPVWMTDSVDAFWLYIAMRNGLPVALLLGIANVLALIGASLTAARMGSADSETVIGVVISLAVFGILGFTVSFFGGALIWYFMVLGIGASFSGFTPPLARPSKQQRPRRLRKPTALLNGRP